jgi:hypothetical protein
MEIEEIKIIIKPHNKGYSMYIIEPSKEIPMTDKMASCYTLARGMIKFGLDTPDMAFDYGLLSFREDAKKQEKKSNGNGSAHKYNDVEKTDNVLDITKLLKGKNEK